MLLYEKKSYYVWSILRLFNSMAEGVWPSAHHLATSFNTLLVSSVGVDGVEIACRPVGCFFYLSEIPFVTAMNFCLVNKEQ